MKRGYLLALVMLLLAAMILAACGGSSNTETAQPGTGDSGNLGSSGNTGDTDDGPSVIDPTGGDTGDAGSSDTTGGATGDMALTNDDPLVTGAVADLAARLGVSETDIKVVRAARVTWPDSSLGCPQPDMSYAQALTEGAFIQLQANGETYNYHGGVSVAPALCESTNETLPEDLGTR